MSVAKVKCNQDILRVLCCRCRILHQPSRSHIAAHDWLGSRRLAVGTHFGAHHTSTQALTHPCRGPRPCAGLPFWPSHTSSLFHSLISLAPRACMAMQVVDGMGAKGEHFAGRALRPADALVASSRYGKPPSCAVSYHFLGRRSSRTRSFPLS